MKSLSLSLSLNPLLLNSRNYRQSVMMDSNFDHTKSLEKHQLTKKEKKKLEKEDKKRRKTERKKSNSTGHSTFYTSGKHHIS